MKVALYARVSDDKITEEGFRRQDVQRQVSKLKEFAEKSGWEITEEHIYIDDGESAFKEDFNSRPAFRRLMRDIRARWVDRVLVEDLSRWSRRLDVGVRDLREAADCGCTITSTLEGELDCTITQDWFKSSVALLFAEYVARSMSEKIKSGMSRREADNRRICGSCGVVHMGRHPLTCKCVKCIR